MLADEFRRQAPQLGDLLAISYEGRVQPQTGGTPYAKYRLLVDRPVGDVEWRVPADDPIAAPAPGPDEVPL